MKYKFTEVLNDLVNYFLLGDIELLRRWKQENNLSDNLAAEFTSNESADHAVSEGIILPMTGIENYPYTIIFNLGVEKPELLQPENRLQYRHDGYSLKIENNLLMLFTWRILERFTEKGVRELIERCRLQGGPVIEIENGWYRIEVLGGETLQDEEYEPTLEFIVRKTDGQKSGEIDINTDFYIRSSVY